MAAETSADGRRVVSAAEEWRKLASECRLAPSIRKKAGRKAYEAIRDRMASDELAAVPLSRLKDTTEGRVRISAIEAAGIKTVAEARAAGARRLEAIPGVGAQTAAKVTAAARQLESAIRDTVRVRLDAVTRPQRHTVLLGALWAFDVARRAVDDSLEDRLSDLVIELDGLIPAASKHVSRVHLLVSRSAREEARAAVRALSNCIQAADQSGLGAVLADASSALAESPPGQSDLWADYERRAAFYNGLLIEVAELRPDQAAVQGHLPAEIAQAVHEHPLDTSLLNGLSLRGYQAFGAKFALCQGKAILGDEMGLGKTIEALAVMSHLHAEGASHSLVVCPASVLVNWIHEVQRHSRLEAHRLHGQDFRRNLKVWARRGGIGVTTFQALQSFGPDDDVELALVVVDEAHYVKNPTAKRTKAVARLVHHTDRAVYLTGTPMENKVDEFRCLVGQVQPDLARSINSVDGLAGAIRFRQAVAPAYLRRTLTDVLEELPDKIETEEWVELVVADFHAYRLAVASRNFMAMRRAAYAPGDVAGSAKLERLKEIVDEAMASGQKVVIFSYFLDVLTAVMAVVGEASMGPMSGRVSPVDRQALLDEFTARPDPAVLVSQIDVGGVGLNMQAASVVILTEPQWKPTTEAQAIARCHRMGQVRPVTVHRLLSENSVDERMLEVLANKRMLFDEYVASEITRLSPDAVDVSDADATKRTASQVEAERRIMEMERKRLGIDDERPESGEETGT